MSCHIETYSLSCSGLHVIYAYISELYIYILFYPNGLLLQVVFLHQKSSFCVTCTYFHVSSIPQFHYRLFIVVHFNLLCTHCCVLHMYFTAAKKIWLSKGTVLYWQSLLAIISRLVIQFYSVFVCAHHFTQAPGIA